MDYKLVVSNEWIALRMNGCELLKLWTAPRRNTYDSKLNIPSNDSLLSAIFVQNSLSLKRLLFAFSLRCSDQLGDVCFPFFWRKCQLKKSPSLLIFLKYVKSAPKRFWGSDAIDSCYQKDFKRIPQGYSNYL